MKTLYLECKMGAAGDMLLGALLELLPDPAAFIADMNGWGLAGVEVTAARAQRRGITGTRVSVRLGGREEESLDAHHGEGHSHAHHGHDDDHHHGVHMADIERTVAALPLTVGVKADILAVYTLLAAAESRAHGCPVEAVHFSEVGMMDAIADIAGVCALMAQIAPARVIASPIAVGSGQVHSHHGVLPVPAPATAFLLEGLPSVGGPVEAELCTPTGAALLRHFATGFGPQPLMTTAAVGYGLGKKDFAAANCVRAFLGEEGEGASGDGDEVVEIACNLDDMTGEELGFAQALLLERGALDVFTIPIQMKKGRPGQMLVCLCEAGRAEEMAALMLRHTTTFGVRSRRWQRQVLAREVAERDTPWGPVRVKAGRGHGAAKSKPEYEDIARLARENDLPLREVARSVALDEDE